MSGAQAAQQHDEDVSFEVEAPRPFVRNSEPMTEQTYTFAISGRLPRFIFDALAEKRGS